MYPIAEVFAERNEPLYHSMGRLSSLRFYSFPLLNVADNYINAIKLLELVTETYLS